MPKHKVLVLSRIGDKDRYEAGNVLGDRKPLSKEERSKRNKRRKNAKKSKKQNRR